MEWDILQACFLEYRNSGSPDATTKVYEKLDKILKSYIRKRLKNSEIADEIVQQCLLKIHLHRSDYDSSREFRTWVFTIASRTLIDHFRRSAREQKLFSVRYGEVEDSASLDGAHSVSTPSKSPDEIIFEKQIWAQAMKLLKKPQQELLAHYFEDDLAMKDLAQNLSITESAAKVRLHRIYSLLRKVF